MGSGLFSFSPRKPGLLGKIEEDFDFGRIVPNKFYYDYFTVIMRIGKMLLAALKLIKVMNNKM